jgi:hypothetical protein
MNGESMNNWYDDEDEGELSDEYFEWIKNNVKCCQCEGSLKDSKHLNIVSLNKKAYWKNPIWTNLLVPEAGYRAMAIVCDRCVLNAQVKGRFEPKWAVEIGSHLEKDGDLTKSVYDYVKYHPIDALEDTFEITEEMVSKAEAGMYDFGVDEDEVDRNHSE